jgi:anaerobic selenocysteine-containing dehydrogenase
MLCAGVARERWVPMLSAALRGAGEEERAALLVMLCPQQLAAGAGAAAAAAASTARPGVWDRPGGATFADAVRAFLNAPPPPLASDATAAPQRRPRASLPPFERSRFDAARLEALARAAGPRVWGAVVAQPGVSNAGIMLALDRLWAAAVSPASARKRL